MPEPEEIRFACVGCGAMNPAGAEVCSGCSHRFAGPGGGTVAEPATGPVPAIPEMHFRDDELYKPGSPSREETALGCLAKVVGTTVAVSVASVVAFFVTCVASFNKQGGNMSIWTLLMGLTAAGLVVGFAIWIASSPRNR